MMTWYEQVISAHIAVTDAVSHGSRLKSDRYFVWQEDGENSMPADDGHVERAVTGRTELFSKTPFDPWGDALGAAFDSAGISWRLVMIDREEDTGFYHWSWDWEVVA